MMNFHAQDPSLYPLHLLSSWGRRSMPGKEIYSTNLEWDSRGAVLFRGMGRSYGDSSLPANPSNRVINTCFADRIRSFDRTTGRIRAEAGLTLLEINRLFLRKQWFSPVTPGTQYVTLGGMVAADVHGKNHHRAGCFGDHVHQLRLRTPNGRILECSENRDTELFYATIGGMGLTGHILEIEFSLEKIPTPWIWQETTRIEGIDEFIQSLKIAAREWPFTVGWIDCLTQDRNMGRGILMCGRWATPEEAPSDPPPQRTNFCLPISFPSWTLNRYSIQLFNSIYFHHHIPRVKKGIVHPESFFYPLDSIRDWNKMYGASGFTQYQCVLPEGQHPGVAKRFMELVSSLECSSFLCVIKDCGREGRGILSFPMPGITIALDIPIRKNTQTVIDTLNEFTIGEGGRINPCKDTFTKAEHYRAMERRLDRWSAIRQKWDPERRIHSAQSVRLLGDPS